MSTARQSSKWLIGTLIFLAILSTAVASLGTPLLPTVQNTFGVSLDASQWTLTITLLVGAVATPVLGRLGSGSAHRATTIATVAAMALGCILSALPLNFAVFLTGRAIQGLGLSLVPLATATARLNLPEAHRARTMATIGVTTAAGIGIGYPIVGVLAHVGGLALPFWLVAALSVLCLAATVKLLPRTKGQPSRVGAVSSILLAAGLTLVLLVLSEGVVWGWGSPASIAIAVVGLVLLAVWAWWELRVPRPLIDLRLLRHPAVAAANISVFLIAIGFYPLAILVVRLVQTPTSTGYGFGAGVIVAGLMLTPFSLASFVASRVVHPLTRYLTAEAIVAISCVFPIASFLMFWLARTSYLELLIAMTLNGLGVGFVYAVNPLQIAGGVPAAETSSAMSAYQLNRTVAYSIGSALSATLLISTMPSTAAYPLTSGYSVAAIFGVIVLIVALAASTVFAFRAHHRVQS
jgi:MFS family permease